MINTPFQIGHLILKNRLVQGPLAGYSCAPYRALFYQFTPPAYCVSEMISAHDVVYKHTIDSRYLHRDTSEQVLCYQLAGHDSTLMAHAAEKLESIGADLIDINCGCPKDKIRKKGLGSALLVEQEKITHIIQAIKQKTNIPVTVKIRIQDLKQDLVLAKAIEEAGADALIIHGRRWFDDYDVPCDFSRIKAIKQHLSIPVIANGDITSQDTLHHAIAETACDAYMICRAGTGQPWLYHDLLTQTVTTQTNQERLAWFMTHLSELAQLEDEYKAVLQSRSLVRYYFRHMLTPEDCRDIYALSSLREIQSRLRYILVTNEFSVFCAT